MKDAQKVKSFPRCRAKLKENDNLAEGFYCAIEGKHYIVLDDAELLCHPLAIGSTIDGFVEIDPATLEVLR